MSELPGDQPITLSSIAKRIDSFQEVMVAHFGNLSEQVKALSERVERYEAEVRELKEKLKSCPSIHPNGGREACGS